MNINKLTSFIVPDNLILFLNTYTHYLKAAVVIIYSKKDFNVFKMVMTHIGSKITIFKHKSNKFLLDAHNQTAI